MAKKFTPEQIRLKVVEILCDGLGVDEEVDVRDDARVVDDLGADSLDVVELVMTAEEEFGIEITDENAEKVKTVKDFTELVTRLLT